VKAAVVGDRGVAVRDVPRPAPAPNEVLIRVHASSLNRADLIVASGQPHGKLFGTASRLGLECAGEVEAVGSEVADLKAGDRVMASAQGGFAEYAVTDWGRVHRIPANNMTYQQATCFPVALQTMHNAVVTAGRFKPGETLLVQGASSSVGLMGMQIGKLIGASLVIGISTNASWTSGIGCVALVLKGMSRRSAKTRSMRRSAESDGRGLKGPWRRYRRTPPYAAGRH